MITHFIFDCLWLMTGTSCLVTTGEISGRALSLQGWPGDAALAYSCSSGGAFLEYIVSKRIPLWNRWSGVDYLNEKWPPVGSCVRTFGTFRWSSLVEESLSVIHSLLHFLLLLSASGLRMKMWPVISQLPAPACMPRLHTISEFSLSRNIN